MRRSHGHYIAIYDNNRLHFRDGSLQTVDSYGLCKKCTNSIPNTIKYYDLIPFWLSLTPDERNTISMRMGDSGEVADAGTYASQTKAKSLSAMAPNLIPHKNYALAEKLLKEAEKICELAMKYELMPSTKGGFDGRLKKLK